MVGPHDMVERTCLMAGDFPELALVPLPYDEETEALSVLESHLDEIDIVFFTGNWPYHYVTERRGFPLPKPTVYVSSHAGSSLHKTLAQMAHRGVDIGRISVDTLSRSEIREAYGEIGLDPGGVHPFEITRAVPRRELVDFHLRLWQRGETRAAVTFLRTAFAALEEAGVPVFRCTPSTHAIREALLRAVLEARALRAKAAQIAVGLCRLADAANPVATVAPGRGAAGRGTGGDGRATTRGMAAGAASGSELSQARLKLLQILFDLAGDLAASVFPVQGHEFVLFTTRGALEQATASFRSLPILEVIRETLATPVSFGFGVGSTAQTSHRCATVALDLAIRHGGDCAFVCFDDGAQVGPLGRPDCLEYSRRAEPAVIDVANRAGLSSTTVNRLRAVLQRTRSDVVTARGLAAELGITPRNARRILQHLAQAGLATVVQVEQPPRGRPSLVYRLDIGGRLSLRHSPPPG